MKSHPPIHSPTHFITPFRWDIFQQKQRVLIRKNGLLKTLPSLGFHMGVYLFNQFCWGVDALFPSNIPIPQTDQSIFILGHQRSGTTFLHRLMAQNDWANSLNLHEMLFPASSFQWGIHKLWQMDKLTGHKIEAHFNRIQSRAFQDLDKIHRVRFNEPEEDEFVMWSQYASDMCINDSPTLIESAPSEMPKEFEFWNTSEQMQALMWYRACVEKKLQRQAGKGLYVGKNPRFSRIIPLLNQTFPKCKIIVLMRNPLEAIPSRMSLMRALWSRRDQNFEELSPAHVQWILNNSIQTFLKQEVGLQHIPEDRKIVIGYKDLKTNTTTVLERIIKHLELPDISPQVRTVLDNMKNHSYMSKHQYDLNDFGLTETEITGPLTEVFEQHSQKL